VHVGDPEQRGAGIFTCSDEPADVGVSGSDHSLERCGDLFEPGQLAPSAGRERQISTSPISAI
jgi:hypothetical protein